MVVVVVVVVPGATVVVPGATVVVVGATVEGGVSLHSVMQYCFSNPDAP